ncbi:peptidase M17 [Couchioplanes caeruleus subsp. caeruleus]|uniref:Probable cytosol aminopeptidase n=1 Tax=Couchioplanes caeruleus subsp. caeruleus TaxID=56427 RepID=A0A1K0FSM2_9ACTN|nr:peptidase M17 [Couchioplanes caeruleus subsp. caeruleus]
MFGIRLVDAAQAGTQVVVADESAVLAGGDDEIAELHRGSDERGRAGAVLVLPRPLRTPAKVVIVGVGAGDEAGWRSAGAAAVRAVPAGEPLHVVLPAGVSPTAVRGLAEGLWLAAYRFREAVDGARSAGVTLQTDSPDTYAESLETARVTAAATWLARDLTNMPPSVKNPAWFADQLVAEAASRPGLEVTVREPDRLRAEGFGGLLAVGGGSASPPRLLEIAWRPEGATRHVVLVGKGITFDTGGISIKPREGMKLMKKDMGGAAAVVAATLGAADLGLPVRITALAPLAENAISGSAYRPGDVITQWDGTTTETTNSDAEGRLVLADVLAYAVAKLHPDVVIDLATLTGANAVALGKRTAALYSRDDSLAADLEAAGQAAGERMWRLPLPAEYTDYLRSDIADRHSSPSQGAGSVVAALFLSEFLGDRVDHWAHLDMSAPAWSDANDADLTKGATGWGTRTLLRYLSEN